MKKFLFLSLLTFSVAYTNHCKELSKNLIQNGYHEIYSPCNKAIAFNKLYEYFDTLLLFLQANRLWTQKLYIAKERFIRSSAKQCYSTDFFGLYDESKERAQIAFYYSSEFHQFLRSFYKEIESIPEIINFLNKCQKILAPYAVLVNDVAQQLKIDAIFNSTQNQPPLLFKVIKYFPGYTPSKAHYDGSALTLLVDSTNDLSLKLSPYKESFSYSDFASPTRQYSRGNSFIVIPGTHIADFSFYPTPHFVAHSGNVRYATIIFAMRPNYNTDKNIAFAPLIFNH